MFLRKAIMLSALLVGLASCGNKDLEEVKKQRQSLDLEKSTLDAERRGLQISKASIEEQKASFAAEKSAFDAFRNEENERILERKKALELERKAFEQVRVNLSRDQAKIMLRADLRMLFKDFINQKTGGFGNALLGLVVSESDQEAFVIDPIMQLISTELLSKSTEEFETLASSKDQRKALILSVILKNRESITESLSAHFKQAAAFLNSLLSTKAQ